MITKENLAWISSLLEDEEETIKGWDKESIYIYIMDCMVQSESTDSWVELKKIAEELTEFMDKVYPLISDNTEDLG